jgi:hypothetical protein
MQNLKQRKEDNNIITLPVSKKVSPVTAMTGKQFSLHIKNTRNLEIEKLRAELERNQTEMKAIRKKHETKRLSFYKMPVGDLKKYRRLQVINHLLESSLMELAILKF